jgi:cytochrome P450
VNAATGRIAERLPAAEQAPGPRFLTPFGFLAVLRRDPLGCLMAWTREYGDVVHVRFPPFRNVLVTNPSGVQHILQTNHRNYWKGAVFGKLKRIAGEGLVFSDGELWRRQRRLIQPAFHRQRIEALAGMMTERTLAMLDGWQDRAAAAEPFDVAAEMSRLTLDIVGRALFGTDLGPDEEEFRAAVAGGLAYANHVLNHFLTPPLFVPTAANRRGRRAIRSLDRIVWGIIERHRREGADGGDLLGMLIAARDGDTNQAMDDHQLRDEAVTFLVAGHETTAVALAWTWHLLAAHEEARRRLEREIDEVLEGRPPVLSDLAELRYARMVLEESMRLYPPVWAVSRQSLAEDEVCGFRLPARTVVTLSPYVTHRNPVFWDDPERFEPERFSTERSAERPEYAYFPFGGGPRGCVGNQFAMMEAQLVLATVAQRFRLRAVPGHVVEPDPILTLRPRSGIRVTLERRA